MKKVILIVIVVLIGALGGYFVLRGNNQKQISDSGQQKLETSDATTSEREEGTTETKEITLIGQEFEFNPSSITLLAGQKVKIIFRNEGAAPHNFTINGLDIGSKTIFGGQTDIVEFTAPESGDFEFFCSVPGHKAAGMKGQLKVE